MKPKTLLMKALRWFGGYVGAAALGSLLGLYDIWTQDYVLSAAILAFVLSAAVPSLGLPLTTKNFLGWLGIFGLVMAVVHFGLGYAAWSLVWISGVIVISALLTYFGDETMAAS